MADTKTETSKRKRIKTCFVTAPRGTDLTGVTVVLQQRKIEPIIAGELSNTTGSVLSDVTAAITKADLVIAVLPPPGKQDNIIFEVGLAYGLRKRLLVVAPHSVALPMNMEELQFIRSDAQNREALSFALDQTLAAKPRRTSRNTSIEKTKPLGAKVEPLLAELHAHPNSESDVINLIVRAIKDSGASTVVEHGPAERGFDLAVWADELGTWVGNPLLIELKRHVPSRVVLDQIVSAGLHYNPSRCVLLLYVEGDVNQVRASLDTPPFVFMLSVEEFLNELRRSSFGDVITRLRNQSYHGLR